MSYFEIAIYGMAVDDQGVHTLAEAIYEPIAFYDVIVTHSFSKKNHCIINNTS